MNDLSQGIPTATFSPQQDEATPPGSSNFECDHSSGQTEFQGQPVDSLEARIHRRIKDIDAIIKAKEDLILRSIDQKHPEPFFLSWKREVNQIFALRVRLKRRLNEVLQSKGEKKAG